MYTCIYTIYVRMHTYGGALWHCNCHTMELESGRFQHPVSSTVRLFSANCVAQTQRLLFFWSVFFWFTSTAADLTFERQSYVPRTRRVAAATPGDPC